ncbi:MAG: CHAT domain-containing protein [Ideonella sp.]|nr:CHAT domain-containing protein [Ideonella sp.]
MADRLAAARALKERCYAVWHTDPAEVLRCAAALGDLAAGAPDGAAGEEVRALAQWTAAIADLVEARLSSALERLELAHDTFAAIGCAADAAQTRVPRIMALALLGRFDAAIECAAGARRALLAQGDRRSAAKVMLNTGSLCMQRDRYRDAAGHYRAAAALFARIGDREHSVLADVGQADALAYLGATQEAEALYRRALARARTHRLPVIESAVVQAIAEIALARGSYREALAGLEQASRDFARLGLPLLQIEADKALADAYVELRLLPEADALYADVLARLDAHEAAATRAWVWLHRARLRAARNELGPALEALAQADRLFAEMDSPAGQAAAQLARSELSLAAGAADAARAAATAARDHFAAIGLPLLNAQLALAEADAAAGNDLEAKAGFDALLAMPETASPLCERAWLGRGRLLRRTGRPDAARHAFEQAVALAEATRHGLPGDDFRRAYLDRRAGAYEELLRLALEAHDAEPGEASAEAVLVSVERRRARTLRDRLGLAAVAREREPEPGPVRAKRERLDWLYRRLNRFLRDGDAHDLPATLHAERSQLEQWLLEHDRRARIAQDLPAPQAGPIDAMSDLRRVRETLGSQTSLVAYAELDDELFAVTLAHGRVQLHRRIARWPSVQAALRDWRGQLATQQIGSERLGRHAGLLAERARRCLERLHALVWQPLAATLSGVTTVRIVPCGALAAMPFAALWDGRSHLVESLDTVLAASVEPALRSRPSRPIANVVAVADTLRLPGASAEATAVSHCWPGAILRTGGRRHPRGPGRRGRRR